MLEELNLTVEAKPKVLCQEQVGTDVRGSLGDRPKMNRTRGMAAKESQNIGAQGQSSWEVAKLGPSRERGD